MKKKHLRRDIKDLQKRITILDVEHSKIERKYEQLHTAVGKMVQALRAEHPDQKKHMKMMVKQRREWPEMWDWINIVADYYDDQSESDDDFFF